MLDIGCDTEFYQTKSARHSDSPKFSIQINRLCERVAFSFTPAPDIFMTKRIQPDARMQKAALLDGCAAFF
jgi:hypothetical protein